MRGRKPWDKYAAPGSWIMAPITPHHGLPMELQRPGARSRLIAILLACVAMLQPNALFADMIPVRHTEGLIHGFLVVRTLEGKAIADGQMTQDARGDRVTTHLIFRLKMVRSMRTPPHSLNAVHSAS